MPPADYDVIVLGSGLGGATLAAVLARHGRRVLLLERGRHPRFAIGESVVPEFSFRAKLMAASFDVAELGCMGNFRSMARGVSSRTGVKRNFTFLHHRAGRAHEPGDSFQFRAMPPPLGPDSHILRSDLDAWLVNVAIRHGATYLDRVEVRAFDVEGAGVSLATSRGDFRADFLVDGSGRGGLMAEELLLDDPGMATDTRSLFTHLVDVAPLGRSRRELGLPSPPDQGTLHHLFDGGWFWIIPFSQGTGLEGKLTSVGLTLDRRRYPETGASPEEEFHAFLGRFPTVAEQLRGARAVRDWTGTGRVQHATRRAHGERWCLLPHTASFVDALFSGGLATTLSGVQEIARALLREGDDRRAGLAAYGELVERNRRFLDELVHGTYVSFRSAALFGAWYRFWAVANYHASLGLVRIWLKERAGEREALEDVHAETYRYLLASGHPRVRGLIDAGYAWLARVESGEVGEEEATGALFELLARQDWIPPQFRIADPGQRRLASFSFAPMVSMILWGKRNAPPDVRSSYYDVPPRYFREVAEYVGDEARRGPVGAFRGLREAFWS